MLEERARTKEQRALILEESIVSLKMWRCQGGHPADVDILISSSVVVSQGSKFSVN